MQKKGVLLINTGSPAHYDNRAVYRYLKEFLNDPRIVDLPIWLRWPLVNLLIIPFRYRKTAKAYKKIWVNHESPLLINSMNLQEALADELADSQVELGMRYGQPSIQSALAKLKDCTQIVVVPLFPQYSSAATGSAIEKFLGLVKKQWNIPELIIKRDFYNHPGFIAAYAEVIKNNLQEQQFDLLLFSYHGLPERHIEKSECKAECDHLHACPKMNADNRYCYRAQCYETSSLLAKALDLAPNQYGVAFQSRLGQTPWIKPYSDLVLPELRNKGIKRLAVVCPSFVADCLETLEEVDIRMREQWRGLGGEEFIFIPCLNDQPTWVSVLTDIITKSSMDLTQFLTEWQ